MKGLFEIIADEGYVIKGMNPELYNYTLPNGMTVKEYIENMVFRGWKRWNGDGNIHVEAHVISIPEFLLVMTLQNGEVLNMWPMVKILTTDMDRGTPVGLVDSVIFATDLEPERQKTWREWIGVGQPDRSVTEYDGYTYFGAHLGKSGIEIIDGKEVLTTGHALTGTELMVIHNSTDAELLEDLPVIEDAI